MTKKIIIGTVITAIAVTLLLTFSNVAYSSPIGDTITVTVSTSGIPLFSTNVHVLEGVSELNAQPILIPGFGTILVTLDVEDGEIWVTFDGDPGIVLPAVEVHIEDFDWLDENGLPLEGQITEVVCFGGGLVESNVDSIWILVEEGGTLPFEFHCEFNTEHVPPPEPACITEHWDKIIFEIVRDPSGKIPHEFLKTELDIKVLDKPGFVADIRHKITDVLVTGPPVDPASHEDAVFPTLSGDEAGNLKLNIIDVVYAIVCIEFVDVM